MIAMHRRDRRRRGMASLIEALAAIALLSAVFTATAGLLHLMMRLERGSRDELAATIAEGRLAIDVRDDVHAAIGVTSADDGEPNPPDRLELELPGGASASYRVDGEKLRRLRIDPSGRRRFESYRLPRRTNARWERVGRGGETVVALVLERPEGPRGEGRPRTLRIEAVLGRDHRFKGGTIE